MRVCKEVGVELSERDVENMLSVLAPSFDLQPMNSGSNSSGANSGSGGAGNQGEASRAISYDKFASLMQSGFRRSYAEGSAVFSQVSNE